MRDLITEMEGAETKALPLLTQLKLSDPGNQYRYCHTTITILSKSRKDGD